MNWNYALGGATSGASAGAAFGPIGAGVGGVAGGLLGLLSGGGGGEGPSAEERQLAAWLRDQASGRSSVAAMAAQQAQRDALSVARSATGNPYLNLRMAQQAQADIAGRAAMAGVQERLEAERMLANYLMGLRRQGFSEQQYSDAQRQGLLGGAFLGASQLLGRLGPGAGKGGQVTGGGFGSSGAPL